MAEQTPARELSHLLLGVLDDNLGYLKGALSAADAISDLLFDQAEENGAVYASNRGLRWALQEAADALGATSDDLDKALRLARELAGLPSPERRVAEAAAEVRDAQAELAASVRDLRA